MDGDSMTITSKCNREIEQDTVDAALRPVLRQLCDLFCLYNMESGIAELLEGSYVTPTQAAGVRSQVRR